MKKALRFILLTGIFCACLLSKGNSQQYFITYSFQDQVVCDTICDTLAIAGSDVDMQLVEFVDWQVDGTSNYQFVDQYSIFGCFFNNFVTADVYLINGAVVQVTEFIQVSQPPIVYEVFTDAFNQCPAANNGQNPAGTNNCDIVCPGSTLTYTWEYTGDLVDINVTSVPGSNEILIDPSLFSMQITWPDPGFYAFSIYFQGQCGSTIRSLCVEVLEKPVADFSSVPAPPSQDIIYLCQGQSLQLENNSQHASSFSWNLGNGNISTNPNPLVHYDAPGIYTLELTAYNDCLCSNNTQKTVVVEEAVVPIVDCIGTVCENSIATYEAAADCSEYLWEVSANGTIIDGGGPADDFLTVSWGDGPEGIVELQLMDCSGGNTCTEPVQLLVPILSEEGRISGTDNVCRGDIISYQMTPFEGTFFEWSVSPYGSIVEGDGTNEIIVEWFDGNIPGNPDHWVAVEYENCYLGCGGRDTLEIQINPAFYTTGPLEVCRMDSTQHEAISRPGNNLVNCSWQVLDNTGSLIWQSSVPTASPTIPWDTPAGSYQVIAIPEDTSAYCLSSYRALMNVLPLPEIQGGITGDTLICPGQSYTYEATANDPRASVIWEINDGGTVSMMEGNAINYIFGGVPPYELNAYAQDPFGCTSAAATLELTGIPPVTIQGDANGCVESSSLYSADGYPEIEYEWEIIPAGRGTITGPKDSSSIEVLWHSAGTAAVAVSICGQEDTIELMISPPPMPIVMHPNAICNGEQAMVEAQAGFSDYTWYDDNGNNMGNAPNNLLFPGTYELEATDGFGCTGSTTFQIEAYPEPAVNITTPDPNLFCNVPISTRLFANTSGAGYDYQWYAAGNPVGSNSPQYTATAEGVYYVEITDVNGCVATSNTITVAEDCVNGPPLPGPNCPATPGFEPVATPACDTREYQNLSAGSLAWIWNFDDPASGADNTSSLEHPIHTYSEVGFYRVLLLAGYPFMGNPDSLVYCPTIRVDTVLVKADFTADTVCAATPTTFEDLSAFLPITSIASWQWDFGDPTSGLDNTSSLENPTHVYANPGMYNVNLTITAPSGCTSTRTRTIEVKSLPDVDFTLPSDNCEDIALPFFALVSDDVTSLSWDFGDPSSGEANQATEADTYHDYTMQGDYDITLEAQSIYGCENSLNQQITIVPNTLAGAITAQPGSVICEGDTAMLTAPTGGSSWLWSTGETSESILATQTGIYTLTVTDNMGCTYAPNPLALTVQPPPETIIRLIEFNDLQQPVNYYYDNYEACEGTDVTLEVVENPNFSYEWSTGNTGTSIDFLEDREEQLTAGTYTFDVTVTNNLTGCTNTSVPFEVIIHPLPQKPQISASPGGVNCEGDLVTFQVDNVEPGVAYTWSNGLEGPSMQATEGGAYFVTAQTPNGCKVNSGLLNIIPGPDVSLIPNGCYSRCRPDTLCLPEVPGVVAYQWLLDGNPVGPSGANPPELVATTSGSYQLEMENNFGCTLTSDPLDLVLFDGIGTLLGQVWIDVNENGLIDVTDTLYSGATIELLQNNNLQGISISNLQGNYAFPNIEASDYTLLLDTLSLPDYLIPLYTQVDTALVGCGSEVLVNWLLQNLCEPDTTIELRSGCDTVNYNGLTYSQDTAFTETFSSLIGCDSVVQVSIDIFGSSDLNLVNLTACGGDTLFYAGFPVPAGDTLNLNYTNLAGCDSVITVIVQALPTSDSTLMLQACEGTTIDYNGTMLTPGDEQAFVFSNVQGCDSTITVIVESLATSDSTLLLQTCEGTSITYNGTELNPGDEQSFVFANTQGCDSTVTVMVEALLASDSTLFFEACDGNSITYAGMDIPAGSQEVFAFTNAAGCDSTVTVEVAALVSTDSTLQLSACEGSTVVVNGQEIPAGTQQTFTLANAAGCDSLLTVEVEAVDVFENTLQLVGCEGDSTFYNGQFIPVGETQEFVYTAATGCDSIVMVQVGILNTDTTNLMLTACPGETVNYNGDQLAAGAQEQYLFLNQEGCDSIVKVTVIEAPAIALELSTTNSCPNEDTGIMGIELLPGSASPLEFSLDGVAFESGFTYTGLAPGVYDLTARDTNGCEAVYEVTIEQEPPLLINIESRPISCEQPVGQLQANVLSGDDGSLILEWSNDTTGTLLIVTEAGLYQLIATNSCDTRTYEVLLQDLRPDETSLLYVPNAFSPNGDGVNDTFRGYTASDAIWRSYHLMVFDRWGDMLFETNDPEEGWDGDMRSQPMNNAVQVWHVEGVVESCGRIFEVKRKGDITIVR